MQTAHAAPQCFNCQHTGHDGVNQQYCWADKRLVNIQRPQHNKGNLMDSLFIGCAQVGYVMQVTGEQLSEELRELLPDFELAFEGGGHHDDSGGFSAYYYTERTRQLNTQFGDMLYKIQDLEVGACLQIVIHPRSEDQAMLLDVALVFL